MAASNVVASTLAGLKPWALAFVILGATTLVNFSLQSWMAGRAPFIPFFPALVLIGLYAGLWPAIASVGLSIAVVAYFWIPPAGWSVGLNSDLASLVFFAIAASVVIAVSVRARALITAHEQARAAQEAVRESEERLLLALEGAQIGMWSTDLSTRVTHSSEINLRLFGLPLGNSDVPAELPAAERRPTDRLPPGQGCVRWLEVFRLLAEKGYRGYLSYEAPNPLQWARPAVEVAREALEATRSLLRRAEAAA